jgi:hypothetical protein
VFKEIRAVGPSCVLANSGLKTPSSEIWSIVGLRLLANVLEICYNFNNGVDVNLGVGSC